MATRNRARGNTRWTRLDHEKPSHWHQEQQIEVKLLSLEEHQQSDWPCRLHRLSSRSTCWFCNNVLWFRKGHTESKPAVVYGRTKDLYYWSVKFQILRVHHKALRQCCVPRWAAAFSHEGNSEDDHDSRMAQAERHHSRWRMDQEAYKVKV